MLYDSPMHLFRAIGLKLVSALLFAAMSALVRQLGDVAPVGQMVFFRSAFAILPVLVIYALRGELATGFYRLGLLLRELSRPENFGMLGYGTFNELIEGRELTTPMNPYRLLSVVDELPPRAALRRSDPQYGR